MDEDPMDEVTALSYAGSALQALARLVSELKDLEKGNWDSADVDLSGANGARYFRAKQIYVTEELREVLSVQWREKIAEAREELARLGVKVPGALD